MLDYKGVVATVSMALYSLLLFPSSYALIRKSFDARFPWFALTIFATIRIVGDALQITLESQNAGHNNEKRLTTVAAIFSAVGLGPLLLVATRLLRQCNSFIHVKLIPNQTHRALFTFELCTVVSTIVTIVGGIQSFKPARISSGDFNATTTLKAGVCLYAATLICISGAALVVAHRRNMSTSSRGQPWFSLTTLLILASMPLFTVRILYSLLSVFDRDQRFSPFGNGSETIQLCLESFPEWMITILYLLIAFLMRAAVPPLKEKRNTDVSDEAQRMTTRQGNDHRSARNILRFVPFVHWFVR